MVLVRAARPTDFPRFLALVRELADFEKMAGPTAEAEARLRADAFGPSRRFDLTLAELDGSVVAYAVTFETYSTFAAKPILYLEDLYVTPPARRAGVARALLAHLARDALARGCVRLAWVVLDWNRGARDFYEGLGATARPTWVPYGLEGDALESLARAGRHDA